MTRDGIGYTLMEFGNGIRCSWKAKSTTDLLSGRSFVGAGLPLV
jgi:hypothetical protein